MHDFQNQSSLLFTEILIFVYKHQVCGIIKIMMLGESLFVLGTYSQVFTSFPDVYRISLKSKKSNLKNDDNDAER